MASAASSLSHTLNLCLFLRHGRYSTIVERLLRVRKTYEDPLILRSSAQLGLLDDHVFWATLYSFVSEITPFASQKFQLLKRLAQSTSYRARAFGAKHLRSLGWLGGDRPPPSSAPSSARSGTEDAGGDEAATSSAEARGEGSPPVCGICGKDPITCVAFLHPCKHPYCYYCLAAHLATYKDTFACKVCGCKGEGICR